MGCRQEDRQQEFWIASDALVSVPGHVFYDKLNRLLDEARFDRFVEELCEPFYSSMGRDSIPPGRYFRMLFVGYFEEIDSQRGIAWRCADSRRLKHRPQDDIFNGLLGFWKVRLRLLYCR